MKKLLIPFDFSEVSENALDYAVAIGKAFNSELILAHCVQITVPTDIPSQPISYIEEQLEIKTRNANEQLKGIVEKYLAAGTTETELSFTIHSEKGLTTEVIPELVEQLSIDMVIMGTKGTSGWLDELLGSRTYRIAERIHVPLLVVPEVAKFNRLQKLVFASNFLAEDQAAIEFLSNFSTNIGAKMTLLHVNKDKEILVAEEKKMKLLEDNNWFSSASLRFEMMTDTNVERGIKQYMQNSKSDILALLTKDRRFWSSLFHHSITKEIAYHAHFPVLIMHL